MRQKITRDIIQTVKIRSDKPASVIDEVITTMWKFVADVMEKDTSSGIYLRHLGTFYGNDKMEKIIAERKKIKEEKNDSGQL